MPRLPVSILWTLCLLLNGAFAIEASVIADNYKNSFQYERTGDYRNAIFALEDVSKAFPDGYTVNLRLGWLYYLNGNLANAIEAYQKAVKAVPTSTEARLGQATVLIYQKKYDEAQSLLYQVLERDNFNYYGNLKLSWVLRMSLKPALAEKIAGKMLALVPSDTQWMVELGWAQWAQGNLDGASATFASVKILDPENVDAKTYFTPVKAGGDQGNGRRRNP